MFWSRFRWGFLSCSPTVLTQNPLLALVVSFLPHPPQACPHIEAPSLPVA